MGGHDKLREPSVASVRPWKVRLRSVVLMERKGVSVRP